MRDVGCFIMMNFVAKVTCCEWIGLVVIALFCLVYAMDFIVLNLALLAISALLKSLSLQLLWIVDIYGFLVAGFLITMGTLGDRIGCCKLLLIGVAAFAVALVVVALSSSALMLIVMRALFGVAGAMLALSMMFLIRNMFYDQRERQFVIGVWIASFFVGGVIGSLVGGVLLQFFWWGFVFLVAVFVMVLLFVLGLILLFEYCDLNAGWFDLVSVALSLLVVLTMIYGLKQIAEHGFAWGVTALVVVGLVVGAVFVWCQGWFIYLLLDLALFRQRRFSVAIVVYGLLCLVMFGVYIFITQYL